MANIEYQRIYENKTRKSKLWYSRAMNTFPGGVNHNIRFFEPYPFVTNAAKGKCGCLKSCFTMKWRSELVSEYIDNHTSRSMLK